MSGNYKAMIIDCAICSGHNWALLTDTKTGEQLTICLSCYNAWSWPRGALRFALRAIKWGIKLVVIF